MNDTVADVTDSARVLYTGRWQRLLARGTWEYCERTHAGGLAAIIIALTPHDEVLFVEQFRVPLQAYTIEMPAGLVGDEHSGESIEIAAIRELEEETGWHANHAQVLMIGPTSSGMSSEKVALVWASDLQKVGEGGGDSNEDIKVHAIARAKVAPWLVQKMKEGFQLDPKLWAGLWLIDHHLDGRRR